MLKASLVAVAVLLSACGSSVTVGSTCSTPGASECSGAKEVAYCEGEKWTGYACPSGCNSGGGDAKCDWKNVVEGESCPSGAFPSFCSGDGEWIICTDGAWTKSACNRCKAGQRPEDVLNCSSGAGRCLCN